LKELTRAVVAGNLHQIAGVNKPIRLIEALAPNGIALLFDTEMPTDA